MDTSLLIPTPSIPSRRLLFSPSPSSPLLPPRLRRRRRRYGHCDRLSLPRCSATNAPAAATATVPAPAVDPSVFGGPKEPSGIQVLVGSLSPPARLASSAILAATAMAAGFGLGVRFGGSKIAGIGGAAVLGAAGGATVYALNSKLPEVAAINLHNLVVGHDDPAELRMDEVESIVEKYGVSKEDDAFKAELFDLYSRFVSSVLPPGGEVLKGNEIEMIIRFKEALGIDDLDAALVHLEIGRHIYRQRLETRDREVDIEQHRAFQKLIYVSTLVFGEPSKFLLPWKRFFNVTDSQVEIAIQDNAKKLYASKLKLIGRDIEVKQLIDLRESQLLYRLSDQIAGEMFAEHTRKLVEENITAALFILKSRAKATKVQVIEELEKVLAFNNLLTSLSKHFEIGQFALGVGPISLLGGEYDDDRKIDDLKLLYRAYAEESFPNGRVQEEKLAALDQLRNIFGLGKREAENIMLDVTSKVYRRRLSRAFSGGDLEAAPSKAAFLQNLCEELHFDPSQASKLHEEIYRQKLQQYVEDGELSEEEVASLQRYRVLVCIHQETADAAHADICGRMFEKVIKDAVASGVDGYDSEIRNSVRKTSKGLRLTTESAMAVASRAVRKVFMTYIQRTKGAEDKTKAAEELEKMIAFNAMVVTNLISDIKGEAVKPDELVDSENTGEEEEWETLPKRSNRVSNKGPSREIEAKLRKKPGQTEITLKDDLSERDRVYIYRTYYLHCLTEEPVKRKKKIGFGSTKKDKSDPVMLSQLGGILGMSGEEIVEVHRKYAEETFMKKAEVILADGQLTKSRIEQLNEARQEVGLPAEYAQKFIKNITTTNMAAAIENAVSQGRMGIQQVRELKEANVDLNNMIPERLRVNLFRRTMEKIFSSGTGEFDEVEVYEKIPSDLGIDADKARGTVTELAKTRISNSLVQAVSLLRQRNRDGVVSSLNDMLACAMAVPAAEPLSWSSPEELADLYCIYLKSIPKPEKLTRLQYMLGISDSTAAALQDTAERGAPAFVDAEEEEEEEEEFVF